MKLKIVTYSLDNNQTVKQAYRARIAEPTQPNGRTNAVEIDSHGTQTSMCISFADGTEWNGNFADLQKVLTKPVN